MQKIKILIIPQASYNRFGGIQRHCKSLRSLLADSDLVDIMLADSIPVVRRDILNKVEYEPAALEKIISESGCDIIHVHGFISLSTIQTIQLARKYQKRIIYSPHFHPFQYLNHPLLAKAFFLFRLKPLLRYIDQVITISATDLSFFKKYKDEVISIPHHFVAPTQQTTVEKKKNRILFVGRNESNKGVEMLKHIPAEYEVICVSNGEMERKDFDIRSGISDQELSELYSSSNLVVIPSRYEAFSYTALEALIHNTPILISDRVEIAFYLEGQPGVEVFQYNNVTEFIEKLKEGIGQKVDVESIKCIFSPNKVKKEYVKVYCDVYENKSSSK